ncbi:MAG TPA: CopD family protein [Gemmatimonadaceae bacterium]
MQAAPLIEWPEPIFQLIDFIGLFLASGAVGFRYTALRGRLGARTASSSPEATTSDIYDAAGRGAAMLGIIGAAITLLRLFQNLPAQAARAKLPVGEFVTSNFPAAAGITLATLALVGFALALRAPSIGWPLALVGVVVGRLRSALVGRWMSLINPIHMLAAGLWIGTLFVLVVVGLGLLFRYERSPERRGRVAADMVNAFSPLALTMGGLVVLFGVITAWRHLNPLSSLWSTPYGWALIAKLVVVAVVFALGAWNWRRQRPALGSETAARSIQRSSRGELVAAGIVLVITAVLVSLPSPKRPGAGPEGAPPGAAAPAGGAAGTPNGAPPGR